MSYPPYTAIVKIKYVATFRVPTHGLTSVMLVSITEEGGNLSGNMSEFCSTGYV